MDRRSESHGQGYGVGTDGVRAEDRAVEVGWDGVCEPRTVAVGVMCM